jgi:hypothetical protein
MNEETIRLEIKAASIYWNTATARNSFGRKSTRKDAAEQKANGSICVFLRLSAAKYRRY